MGNAPAVAFFHFMEERELIRLRREAGQPWPWSQDKILQTYSFTNLRRYHDRTSEFLRKKLYSPNRRSSPIDILMNCATFRYFGTTRFAEAVGWGQHEKWNDAERRFKNLVKVAGNMRASGQKPFTAAYVISNLGRSDPKEQVVADCLRALRRNAERVVEQRSVGWKAASDRMSQVLGFKGSGFMTKETLLDTMFCDFWPNRLSVHGLALTVPNDWDEWTPVGPGSIRGAARLLGWSDPSDARLDQQETRDVIMWLHEMQKSNWDERKYGHLYPHDIQFQLCEFDKYERVRLGQGEPKKKYRRSA